MDDMVSNRMNILLSLHYCTAVDISKSKNRGLVLRSAECDYPLTGLKPTDS